MPIQIIPNRNNFGERLGRTIGDNAGDIGKSLVGNYKQKKTLNAENAAIKKNYNIDLYGIKDPDTRSRIIADELRYGRQKKEANATANIDYSPEERLADRERFIDENKPTQKKDLPEFGKNGRKDKFINNDFPGNAPQPETGGAKRKVLNPDELIAEGKRIQKAENDAGLNTTFLDAYETAKGFNQENKVYNNEVEQDTQQRVQSQRDYGAKAEQKLATLLPGANDEERAYFRRKGEEISGKHTSEAAIDKEIAGEARQYKNLLRNIKNSVPASTLFNKIKSSVLGTSREFDKAKQDIRIKLKPLLDEGLYGTARNLLSELGYQAEETEMIITDLGENSKKSLSQMPRLRPEGYGEYSPKEMQIFTDSLKNTLTNDPTSNLILLRKAYEEKGVDWQTFKDQLNEMILNGEVKLDEDQFDFLDKLEQPPLNRLEKLLHGVRLI